MDGVGTVLPFDRPADRGGAVIDPGDLVKQPIRAEDLVQHNAGVGCRMPVQMQVKRPCRRKELVHKQESRAEHVPAFWSFAPDLAVPLDGPPACRATWVPPPGNASGGR